MGSEIRVLPEPPDVTRGVETGAPTLVLSDISKSFGAVKVLKEVSFEVGQGEIVALLGENGSGKSTLVKILAGVHAPDVGGRIWLADQEVQLPIAPDRSRQLGMSFVFQELGLANNLSLVENFRIVGLGRAKRWHGVFINWKLERKAVAEALARYELELDPRAQVGQLAAVERAMFAIVRAAEELRAWREQSGSSRALLVLDEPTVFLPEGEVQFLFALVERIAEAGTSILLVSHDLSVVRALAKRAVVLRDGRVSGEVRLSGASDGELIHLITAREVAPSGLLLASPQEKGGGPEAFDRADARRILTLSRLSTKRLRGISFGIDRGEIVGAAGLIGSGVEELPGAMFNAERGSEGELTVDGSSCTLDGSAPLRVLLLGVGLVPEDRRAEGGAPELSVEENMLMLELKRYRYGPTFSARRRHGTAVQRCGFFDIRPRNPRLAFRLMSGGNQQKVVIAKWLELSPKVMLLHEPTQGVDVGAREDIYQIVRSRVDQGMSVLWVSSDANELARMCDRVLVFGRGEIRMELTGGHVSAARITQAVLEAGQSAQGDSNPKDASLVGGGTA